MVGLIFYLRYDYLRSDISNMTGKDYKKQHETSSFKFPWKDLWEKDYVICSQRLDDGDLMKLKLFFLYLCVLFFFFFFFFH